MKIVKEKRMRKRSAKGLTTNLDPLAYPHLKNV